ncbi:hypothetical protein CEXT_169791 [Caerostris extrusa]|uniref:Uncharacterized protein n=1 Tax=Caerostris extrusa TaxID=172846 RepID=A0AAV4UN58_CAEEX|nr:hypothetical protein CEXT_169791 [Caerostris extrusa]
MEGCWLFDCRRDFGGHWWASLESGNGTGTKGFWFGFVFGDLQPNITNQGRSGQSFQQEIKSGNYSQIHFPIWESVKIKEICQWLPAILFLIEYNCRLFWPTDFINTVNKICWPDYLTVVQKNILQLYRCTEYPTEYRVYRHESFWFDFAFGAL